MFANFFGLFCASLALGFFAWAHRAARVRPARRGRVWLAVAGAGALPAAYAAGYYLHVVPETAWLYEARSWRWAEAAVVPVGIAGGVVAALLPRALLIGPLLATVGIAFGPFLKPVLAPVKEGELRGAWTKDVCIQSTFSTCGPASAATILRRLGIDRTEMEIARAAHSYAGGTEAWYLARYLRREGVEVRFRVGEAGGLPADVAWPAIVGVRVFGRGHFIAVLGEAEGRLEIGDPMIGPERLDRRTMESRYDFTGFAMELRRGGPGAGDAGEGREDFARR